MVKTKNTLKIVVAAVLIAILGLCGCTSGSKPEPGTTQAENSEEKSESSKKLQTATDPGQTDADKNLIRTIIMANDESLHDMNNNKYRLKCVYETISLDEESAKKYPELERALKAYSEELLAEQRKIIGQAEKDPNLKEGFDMYYENSFNLEATRADSDILSCRTTLFQYTGGAHPNSYVEGVSFDSKTGKRLQLSDVVTSKEDLIHVVWKCLKDNYSDEAFWDLEGSMNSYLKDPEYELKWYLSSDGLCVSFDPYILSSYGMGRFDVVVPYAEHPSLFKDGIPVVGKI